MNRQHRYPTRLSWAGSTGVGYEHYSRTHRVEVAGERHRMSSDPHFGGDPALRNPEQLLVMAASSCQLLSFLAVAARARLDVVGYTDDAVGVMTQGAGPAWVELIALRSAARQPHRSTRASAAGRPRRVLHCTLGAQRDDN